MDSEQKTKFELLKTKEIISILDGDMIFGEIDFGDGTQTIPRQMPYLSGPKICDICNKFGLPEDYPWGGGAASRWVYFTGLLDFCIKNNTISNLLSFLFSMEQFKERINGLTPKRIEHVHSEIVNSVIAQINGELYFGGNELVSIGNAFIIKTIGSTVKVDTPVIARVTRDYIRSIAERALNDVSNGDYDSAITKSRTLLEEVFIFSIERAGEIPEGKGDINKYYGHVKKLYNMNQAKGVDVRINTLLSGLEKILHSISEMRNLNSDAHGVGSKRVMLSDYHARLFVNSATTMADFILSVCENKKGLA